MSDEQHNRDIEVATALGSIDATLKSIDTRLCKVESDLKSAVGTLNRWKGATGIMIIVGGVIGWLGNLLFKNGGHA